MKDYWVKHSVQASIQEMLLDSNAEVISDNELPEIISILPSFKSKVVLELGAGIGCVNILKKCFAYDPNKI
jgi:phosphoethanolamine N-methyltransferase